MLLGGGQQDGFPNSVVLGAGQGGSRLAVKVLQPQVSPGPARASDSSPDNGSRPTGLWGGLAKTLPSEEAGQGERRGRPFLTITLLPLHPSWTKQPDRGQKACQSMAGGAGQWAVGPCVLRPPPLTAAM